MVEEERRRHEEEETARRRANAGSFSSDVPFDVRVQREPGAEAEEVGSTPGTVAIPPCHSWHVVVKGNDIAAAVAELWRLNVRGLAISSLPTDAGLAHLSDLTQLTWLDLSRAGVVDAGLARLAGLTQLTSLSLDCTEVTDAGVERLKRALPGLCVDR